jgi:tetratricopeptide (TPR) repeat protein
MAHGTPKTLTGRLRAVRARSTELGPPAVACRVLAWACILAALAVQAWAVKYDELPLDRWAKLGEADRYQLSIAEKYYREQNWKAALSEYEKFLSLYEKSDGAPYVQLKWSICQVNLHKSNTAIKDGFQSVIDYWPESPEAVTAGYLIGKTYKETGEIKQAKKYFAKVLIDHPDSLAALMSKIELADMARVEGDDKRRLALWNEVVFRADRTGDAAPLCAEISNQLATHFFSVANFPDALKALSTTYSEPQLPLYVNHFIRGPLAQLVANPESKARGLKMADAAVAYVKSKAPPAPKDDAEKQQLRQNWLFVAEIEQFAGRPAEALTAFESIINTFGADDDTLGRKAGLLKGIGRRDDARSTYNRFQNQPEGQHQIAYSFREEQKWDQAIAIYQNLLSSDAKNGQRWNWELACAYRDASRFKEAVGVFRQCDNFPEDLKQMAGCHRRLGEHKEALALYQQVMAHAPSASWALLEIARTYEEAGEKEAAIKAFQQVCKRFPKSGEASAAHARLQDAYKINVTLGGTAAEE